MMRKKKLSRKKNIVLFVDGDRGGDLIIKEVTAVAEVDFVCKAPDGKEVEEMTKKEIHKALRSKVTVEQVKMEEKSQAHQQEISNSGSSLQRNNRHFQNDYGERENRDRENRENVKEKYPSRMQEKLQEKKQDIEKSQDFKRMLEELVGTRGAYILDSSLNILGKVPITELATTLNSLRTGVFAVVLDGTITKDIASVAEKIKVQYLVGKDSKVDHSRISLLTQKQL